MELGLLYEFDVPRPWAGEHPWAQRTSERTTYRDCMQQVVLADRMGLDTIWCVEHHFRGNRSHMPRNEAVLATTSGESVRAKVPRLDPAVLPVLGTAEERWQSYNVEMAEVIGGHRWKPYAHMTAAQGPVSGTRNVYQSAAGSR